MTGATLYTLRQGALTKGSVRHDGYDLVDFLLEQHTLKHLLTLSPQNLFRRYIRMRQLKWGESFNLGYESTFPYGFTYYGGEGYKLPLIFSYEDWELFESELNDYYATCLEHLGKYWGADSLMCIYGSYAFLVDYDHRRIIDINKLPEVRPPKWRKDLGVSPQKLAESTFNNAIITC